VLQWDKSDERENYVMNGFIQAAQEGRLILLGHQGVYGEAPANSLSGFRKAIEMGLDGIETDLHGTLDGRIVLMHDDDVTGTTLGVGKLTEMTFEEARRLNVAGKFRPGFEAEPVPSLEELLEIAKPVPGFLLNLEFKDYPEVIGDAAYRTIDETVRLVEEYGMGERVIFATLSCGVLRYIIEKYGDKYPIESVYPSFLMKGEFSEEIYEKSLFVAMINVKRHANGSRDWGHAQREPVMPHEDTLKVNSYGMIPSICVSPWDTEELVKRCLEEGYMMFLFNYPSNGMKIFKKLGKI